VSLVEVLVVIALLGVLAGIVSVTVRGAGSRSRLMACMLDEQAVRAAVLAHQEAGGGPVTEEALVAGGYLRAPSSRFDVTGGGDVVPSPTGGCELPAQELAGGGGTVAGEPGAPAPSAPEVPSATVAVTSESPVSLDTVSEGGQESHDNGETNGARDVTGGGSAGGAPGDTVTAPPLADAGPVQPSLHTEPEQAPGAAVPPSGSGGPAPGSTVRGASPPSPSDGLAATSTTAHGGTDHVVVGAGPLVVTLVWTGNADLDLWVEDAQGRRIGWSAPTDAGGFLGGDVVPPRPEARGPHVEQVSWPAGALPGTYAAWVHFASGGWGPQDGRFTLAVHAGGELVGSLSGPLRRSGDTAPLRIDATGR
jgi:type II secretory pathway pseudopilin PulG